MCSASPGLGPTAFQLNSWLAIFGAQNYATDIENNCFDHPEILMNRIDRLFGILLLLQKNRLLRAEDLAKRYEISVRTVYRDMAAQSEIHNQ